jgi:hypothetical protein
VLSDKQQFLTTLRLLQNPSTNLRIGIPVLDKLLANHTTQFDPTNLSAIPPPPIIEITSPGPKSGKTEFLYWIIANLVLGSDTHESSEDVEPHQADESTRGDSRNPPDHANNQEKTDPEAQDGDNDTNLETNIAQHPSPEQPDHHIPIPPTNPPIGNPNHTHHTKPSTIALLTTSPIDLPRLTQILLHHLLSTTPNLPLSIAQDLIHLSLSHIHIFQPSSLSSLIATISSLPSYFLDPKNGSAERRVGAIIIDSASTFFWADKAGSTGQAQGQAQSKYPALASMLRRAALTLQAPVFFSTENLSTTFSTSNSSSTSASNTTNTSTTSGISTSTSNTTYTTSNNQSIRPNLPTPFSHLPTLRLIISRKSFQGFSKDTDAETSLKHAEARDKAVRGGGFVVRVDKWGSDGKREREGEGDREEDGSKGFIVRIDEKGVTLR